MSPLLVSVVSGLGILCCSLTAFQLYAALPPEDRAWLDRPPAGFRWVWLLIRLLEPAAAMLLSPARRQAVEQRLCQAGAEFRLTALQFMTGRLVAALAAVLLCGPLLLLPGAGAGLLWTGCALAGWFYPGLWLRAAIRARQRELLQALPFVLDIITLAVEAGNNLSGGLAQAVQHAPDGALRTELLRVLRDIRAGRTRAQALRDLGERSGSPHIITLVGALVQAERNGANLGGLLREQARLLRQSRFRRAEKQALEAPVKLLGPLLLFIFPTTFLVLGFLVLSKAIQEELIDWAPLLRAYYWPG